MHKIVKQLNSDYIFIWGHGKSMIQLTCQPRELVLEGHVLGSHREHKTNWSSSIQERFINIFKLHNYFCLSFSGQQTEKKTNKHYKNKTQVKKQYSLYDDSYF